MKISYKGDYALKTLLELAINYNRGVLSIQELAKRGDIPEKFLEQVLLMLKKAGFVDSKRGVNGGYYLARPPQEIAIGEVVRFIEGPIEPITCVGKDTYEGCRDVKFCVLRDVWTQVYNAVSSYIDKITFAELVNRVKEKKKMYTYSI